MSCSRALRSPYRWYRRSRYWSSLSDSARPRPFVSGLRGSPTPLFVVVERAALPGQGLEVERVVRSAVFVWRQAGDLRPLTSTTR